MQRPITGYRVDEHGDWVALLSCGHPQHVRHQPPFTLRPWVTTEAGRASRLGHLLECVRCDAFELPSHFIPSRRTEVFTDQSVPAGLLKDHTTRAGVWAKIVVLAGVLRYEVPALGVTSELTPQRRGVVIPEVPHHVTPMGPVRFFVEFYASP